MRSPSLLFGLLSVLISASMMAPGWAGLPKPALKEYREAVRLQQAGQLEQAEFHIRQAITLAPYDALSHQTLGMILREEGALEKAVKSFEQAAALDAKDPSIYFTIGALYDQLYNAPKAQQAYEIGLRKNPQFTYGVLSLAQVLRRQGKNPEALARYNEFLSHYPRHYQAQRERTQLLAAQGKTKEAIAEYERLLESFPKRFEDYTQLARLHLSLGQADAAAPYLEQAALKSNANAELAELKGEMRSQKGKSGEAVKAFQEALALNPSNDALQLRLASEELKAKQPKAAETALRAYLEAHPKHQTAQRLLVTSLIQQNRFAEAEPVLESLLTNQQQPLARPDRYATEKQLALSYQRQKKTKEAIRVYENLLTAKESTDDTELSRNLAIAYHTNGQLAKAIPLYEKTEKALNTSPITLSDKGLRKDHVLALVQSADQAYQSGQLNQAKAVFLKAQDLSEALPAKEQPVELLVGLANTELANENFDRAKHLYQEALTLNPQEPEARLRLAQMNVQQQDNLTEAVQTLKELQGQKRYQAEASLALGQAYEALKKPELAITAYQDTLKTDPSNPTAPLLLANVLQQSGDDEKALALYEQVMPSLAPEAQGVLGYRLGTLYLKMQQPAKARSAFEAVLKADPAQAEAHFALASLADANNEQTVAVKHYQEYLTLSTDSATNASFREEATERLTELKVALGERPVTETRSSQTMMSKAKVTTAQQKTASHPAKETPSKTSTPIVQATLAQPSSLPTMERLEPIELPIKDSAAPNNKEVDEIPESFELKAAPAVLSEQSNNEGLLELRPFQSQQLNAASLSSSAKTSPVNSSAKTP